MYPFTKESSEKHVAPVLQPWSYVPLYINPSTWSIKETHLIYSFFLENGPDIDNKIVFEKFHFRNGSHFPQGIITHCPLRKAAVIAY